MFVWGIIIVCKWGKKVIFFEKKGLIWMKIAINGDCFGIKNGVFLHHQFGSFVLDVID